MPALLDAPAKLVAVPAKFGGRCGLCTDPIVARAEDELIVKLDGEWVHSSCAEAEGHEVVDGA